MASGGLKVVEKDIDNRLLGSHHSVRVTDFACSVQNYVHTQTLRNAKKLSVKIGIHTGEVIAGVVGETKPQFSLIGPTINKTARVCSKCPPGKILISKEAHKTLQASASNFVFGSMKADMKGIGLEEVFTVQKRRVQQSKLIGQRKEIIRKN
jgi:class 3 adenylate cyclase|mmetsp:Transcript_20917/g.28172  ORF Transcript_20917/g.28172 Transcript_20917/m.28172 type:complete len:152 (+) Transcript_20917:2022-2477(+)